VDPLAEKYYLVSPYAYCRNNPVNAFDPDEKDWFYRIINKNVEVYYDRDVKSQAEVANKYGKDAGIAHMPDGSTLTAYDKDGNITSKYAFTNDAEENKYGTVVNIDGDKLDNTQIKYDSNYTIFGTSDNSYNTETLHKNYMETSYIGPNNPLDYNEKETYKYMSENISEYPAMVHDMMYDKKGVRGISNVLFNTKALDADKMLYILETAIVASPDVSVVERARALAMALTFKLIFELKEA